MQALIEDRLTSNMARFFSAATTQHFLRKELPDFLDSILRDLGSFCLGDIDDFLTEIG